MKDEIKEILEFKEDADYKRLSVDAIVTLEDYITDLQEENKMYAQLKEEYEDIIDKAIEFIEEKISSTQGVINDYMYHKEHNKILIELLKEDIEMYKKELHILNGGDE